MPHRSGLILLLLLQVSQVLFLLLHDWVPLGSLNDVAAVRRSDSTPRLLLVTAIQTLPFAFGLYATLRHFAYPLPHWLLRYLFYAYGILLLGQLYAWWYPYLFHPDPERAARYKTMFGNTASFLPMRNGIVPNTAHILLHLATAATLLDLFLLSR